MAIQTPLNPVLAASITAKGIRTHQILKKFIILGIIVSPVPRRAPEATMEAAYSGSANTSIRKIWIPSLWISTSGGQKRHHKRGSHIHGAAGQRHDRHPGPDGHPGKPARQIHASCPDTLSRQSRHNPASNTGFLP